MKFSIKDFFSKCDHIRSFAGFFFIENSDIEYIPLWVFDKCTRKLMGKVKYELFPKTSKISIFQALMKSYYTSGKCTPKVFAARFLKCV